MGISHEYHSSSRPRRRRGAGDKLRLLGVVIAILILAYAITAILESGAAGSIDTPQTNASGIAQNILAPLPMEGNSTPGSESTGEADSTGSSGTAQAVQLESFGPARQSAGAYTVKAYFSNVLSSSLRLKVYSKNLSSGYSFSRFSSAYSQSSKNDPESAFDTLLQ